MRLLFFTVLVGMLSLNFSSKVDLLNKKSEKEIKITKSNFFERLDDLVQKKVKFQDLSITYEGLLDKFSPSFKKKFLEEEGQVFAEFLPKWKKQSENFLDSLCYEKGVTFSKTKLSLDKDDKELKAYTALALLKCKEKTLQIRVTAFEIDKRFYFCKLD